MKYKLQKDFVIAEAERGCLFGRIVKNPSSPK